MSYFDPIGYCGGWFKFQFLASADELSDLLTGQGVYLVTTNSRVEKSYKATPISDYITAYRDYLNNLLDARIEARAYKVGVYTSFAKSLKIFHSEICDDDKTSKWMRPKEPAVNFGQLMLHYDGDQLSTGFFTHLCFGLEMTFPKFVSLTSEEHRRRHKTSRFESFTLFEDLRKQILKMTKRCDIQSPSRIHRTSIRITQNMREWMKDHPGLRRMKLKLV